MTTSHIHYEGRFSSQGLNLGKVVNVSPHRGQDRALQVIVHFERGCMRIGDEQAAVIVAEIAAALSAPSSTWRPNVKYPVPNCSGALADVDGGEQ